MATATGQKNNPTLFQLTDEKTPTRLGFEGIPPFCITKSSDNMSIKALKLKEGERGLKRVHQSKERVRYIIAMVTTEIEISIRER
jgi:hypothetical protein